MSDNTPRLALGQMVDGQELDALAINDALIGLDALTDIYLKGQFVNTPPTAPTDGDMYLLGGAPAGAWTGQAYKIAYCIDGAWRFYAPFNGLRAFVAPSNAFLVYQTGVWSDANALISANEVSVASAATCDLGAAASLFVQITGATAITSLGAGANLLRFVRFAGALTLTYNATSLILPGAANIATAAGDSAVFASDAGGNWRCRSYQRANGVPACFSGSTGSGNAVGSASPTLTGTLTAAAANFSGLLATSSAAQKQFAFNSGSANGVYGGWSNSGTDIGYIGSAKALVTGGALGDYCIDTATSFNALVLGVGGTEYWRIGTDGSLLGGTTANGGWSGVAKMEVVKSSGITISGYASGSSGSALCGRVDIPSTNLAAWFCGASVVGTVTTSGSATSYNTTSDARLKTVAREQGAYRAAIQALWVGDFTWKASGAPGFGVLAQQAWDVMPCHAGVSRPTDEAGVWHASAEPFAFLALWGVKDLYAMIDDLAARVKALEAAHAAP